MYFERVYFYPHGKYVCRYIPNTISKARGNSLFSQRDLIIPVFKIHNRFLEYLIKGNFNKNSLENFLYKFFQNDNIKEDVDWNLLDLDKDDKLSFDEFIKLYIFAYLADAKDILSKSLFYSLNSFIYPIVNNEVLDECLQKYGSNDEMNINQFLTFFNNELKDLKVIGGFWFYELRMNIRYIVPIKHFNKKMITEISGGYVAELSTQPPEFVYNFFTKIFTDNQRKNKIKTSNLYDILDDILYTLSRVRIFNKKELKFVLKYNNLEKKKEMSQDEFVNFCKLLIKSRILFYKLNWFLESDLLDKLD